MFGVMSLIEHPKEPTESQLMSSTVINRMLVFAEDEERSATKKSNLSKLLIITLGIELQLLYLPYYNSVKRMVNSFQRVKIP